MKTIVGGKALDLSDEQLEMYQGLTGLQRSVALKKLEGLSDIDSYIAGGGKAKSETARSTAASSIMTNCEVQTFIRSFDTAIVSDAIMGREEMLARLTAMARTEITDVITIRNNVMVETDEDGPVEQSFWSIKDAKDMTGGGTASISELSTSKDGIKIKMHDQKSAMKQIAEIEGFNAAVRFAIGGDAKAPPITVADVPLDPIEAARVYQKMMEGK